MGNIYSIVNIPIEGSIPKEGVEKLLDASKSIVEKIVAN
jgi:hypothetical protein